MKKLLVAIITAVFLSATLSSPMATAAVKAGAKCTKAGATATSGGKKFTCLKSGKKLVWNKGVAIKKPAAPASAPAPTTPKIALPNYAVTPQAPFYQAATATKAIRVVASDNAPCAKVTDSNNGSTIAFAVLQIQVNDLWLDVKPLESGWEKTEGCKESGSVEMAYAPWVLALIDAKAKIRWKAAGLLINMPPGGVTGSSKVPREPFVQAPPQVITFKPTPPALANPVTWENIISRASELSEILYNDVYAVVARNKKIAQYNDVSHKIFRGPNLDPKHYKEFDKWFDDAMAYYANAAKPDSETFIMFPYEDLQWAIDLLSTPEIDQPGYADVMRGANLTPKQGIRQNGVPDQIPGRFDGIWVLPATLGPEGTMTSFAQHERDAFMHEYGHQVQQAQWKRYDMRATGRSFDADTPCFLGEGIVVGPEIALIWDNAESFRAHTRGMGLAMLPPQDENGNRAYSIQVTGTLDAAYMAAYLKDSFNSPKCTQEPNYGLSYSLGYLATEALSAIAGAEAPMAVFTRMGMGEETFDQAFATTFGISWEKALPILAEVMAINARDYPR